jgi:hypothetical protein
MTVRVVDHGADALIRRIQRGRQPTTVKTGVIGDGAQARSVNGGAAALTVADVASFNEFGIGVPERSFIRAYVDENQPQLIQRLRAIARAVAKGKPLEPGLEQFGALVVGEIQRRISAGIAPENHPDTIERKGSSTPLIDTGQLRSSITYLVERGRA